MSEHISRFSDFVEGRESEHGHDIEDEITEEEVSVEDVLDEDDEGYEDIDDPEENDLWDEMMAWVFPEKHKRSFVDYVSDELGF